MKLSKNNHKAMVTNSKLAESLCSVCIYNGCSACPTKSNIYVNSDKYPQIKEYHISRGSLIVDTCDSYTKKAFDNSNNRAKFIWDSKTRRHVKVK